MEQCLCKKGKKYILIICCIQVFIEIINMLAFISTPLASGIIVRIIRIVLTILLFGCVYRGYAWARWTTFVFLLLTGIAEVIKFVGYFVTIEQLLSHMDIRSFILLVSFRLIFSFFWLGSAYILIFNKSVKEVFQKRKVINSI